MAQAVIITHISFQLSLGSAQGAVDSSPPGMVRGFNPVLSIGWPWRAAMSQSLFLPSALWAVAQFGPADLGDKRRTRRAVQLAAAMASASDASIPRLMQNK